MSLSSVAVSGGTLPPLPADLKLPEPPKIMDTALERLVFVHSSYYGKIKDAQSLQTSEELVDNEKLEHVGDSILGQWTFCY